MVPDRQIARRNRHVAMPRCQCGAFLCRVRLAQQCGAFSATHSLGNRIRHWQRRQQPLRVLILRGTEHLVAWALLNEPAVIEHGDAVGQHVNDGQAAAADEQAGETEASAGRRTVRRWWPGPTRRAALGLAGRRSAGWGGTPAIGRACPAAPATAELMRKAVGEFLVGGARIQQPLDVVSGVHACRGR